ncbi:MAG: hypothetical protein WA610_01150, partial [Thermodesulfovibrionales bacterium]
YEEALETINKYEPLYRGHIQMTYLKSNALSYIAETKEGEDRDAINRRVRDISGSICFWSQGQTRISVNTCGLNFLYYHDFPRRWFAYWIYFSPISSQLQLPAGTPPGRNPVMAGAPLSHLIDETNGLDAMLIWLLYTNDDFLSLESSYKKLTDLYREKDAEALWTANIDRFVGSPMRSAFIAQNKKGGGNDAEMIYREAMAANPEVWDSYFTLSKLFIGRGDYGAAMNVLKSYPPFGNGGYDDTVALSNYAFFAGNEFYRKARIDEALYFFRLSASYQTGSSAEFRSSIILGVLDGNYEQAASYALADAKRYEDSIGYAFYITTLHLMGSHDKATVLYDTLPIADLAAVNWMGVIVGFRMAGDPQEVTLKWLTPERLRFITSEDSGKFYFSTQLLDRTPDLQASDAIEKLIRGSSPQGSVPFLIAHFAKGYVSLAQRQYAAAYDFLTIFRKTFLIQLNEFTLREYGYAIPYYVWSSIKSSKTSDAQNLIEMMQRVDENNFYLHLSRAFMKGSKGDHAEAVRSMRSALNNAPNIFSSSISPWYQLVEACEWLYADTRQPIYRSLAVELAIKHQRILPMLAWAYAVEAKYAETTEERRRALAITLYLDKRSMRIASMPDNEKNEAMTWLKNNNPFLQRQ